MEVAIYCQPYLRHAVREGNKNLGNPLLHEENYTNWAVLRFGVESRILVPPNSRIYIKAKPGECKLIYAAHSSIRFWGYSEDCGEQFLVLGDTVGHIVISVAGERLDIEVLE